MKVLYSILDNPERLQQKAKREGKTVEEVTSDINAMVERAKYDPPNFNYVARIPREQKLK